MNPESKLRVRRLLACASVCAATVLVLACGGGSGEPGIARLSAASPGKLSHCTALATSFSYPGISITSAQLMAEGSVTSVANSVTLAQPAHCLLRGTTPTRTGADGKPYAIGFEMRLPENWNGRFFHQVNGGAGGSIDEDGPFSSTRAFGQKLGGSPESNALMDGFAVLSSDAGHKPDTSYPVDPDTGLSIQSVVFGLDPQARRDFGYNMVAVLTPVAKDIIRAAYGRGPDRSYMAGCSNGGRHAMVAAARFASDYDGILAGAPGFNLPKAVVAEMWDSQKLMSIAKATDPITNRPAIWSSFSDNDLKLVSSKVLARCDALDGVADGMIADVSACQSAFSLERDVPACAAGAAPDGSCLSPPQKAVLADILRGPRDSKGNALYADWPVDSAFGTEGWRIWKTG
ncbi:MAG TPA: tannase/feruloyl esterase family alpha/beta hydrolase, partial [Burkholderiaceae bacterium]|nr:tannase/feruloyl esterase family alpha/beta hydrolase [Burkholderiaceae bacterium]